MRIAPTTASPRFAATPAINPATSDNLATSAAAFAAKPVPPTKEQWAKAAIPTKEVLSAGLFAGAFGALTKLLIK